MGSRRGDRVVTKTMREKRLTATIIYARACNKPTSTHALSLTLTHTHLPTMTRTLHISLSLLHPHIHTHTHSLSHYLSLSDTYNTCHKNFSQLNKTIFHWTMSMTKHKRTESWFSLNLLQKNKSTRAIIISLNFPFQSTKWGLFRVTITLGI